MGFPLIMVLKVKRLRNNALELTLAQEKFWADPAMKNDKSHQGYLWMVPLRFSTNVNPTGSVYDILMDKKTITVTIPDAEWVKVSHVYEVPMVIPK